MSVVDMDKHRPEPEPEPATTVAKLTRHKPERTPIDPTATVLPEWVQTWSAFQTVALLILRRGWWRTRRFLVQVPVLVGLLLMYSPRGLGRLVAMLARYLYDHDSAKVRHQHAGNVETPEYVKAQNIRRANLKARWMVAGTVIVAVAFPVLAWTLPGVLAVILATATFIWVVKLIPGKEFWEFIVAAAIAFAVWKYTPALLLLFPPPPAWAVATVGVAAVLAFGVLGRPAGKALVKGATHDAGLPPKPNENMIVDALCRIGIPSMTPNKLEEVHAETRILAPGVARGRHGYHLELELPWAVTASEVMEKREALAAAVKRELGTVWPTKGPRHPGHFRLYLGDQPMATAPQARWPIAQGREIDAFQPIPLFTDQEGKWVDLTFAYNHIVIGGAPGYGKTFAEREMAVACAFDPRNRIYCFDGKGNGDLRPLRLVAHGFYEGDEPEEIAAQLAAVRGVRQEMRRRAKFLRELPREENPLNKVTSELVDKYPHLALIFLFFDEVQVYTEHEDAKIREEFISIMTDLVKRGRSAGIIPVFCTQKPDAKCLPSSIVDNCSVRLCFRVNGWRANDQVLGTEMHSNGIKATLFSAADKGLAWLRGDGSDPLVVRTVYGLDAVQAEELMAQARAIRERVGLLTGMAAGETEEPEPQADLLDDVYEVLQENACRNTSLEYLLDKLSLLRPGIYGTMDPTTLGGALRGAGVTPDSVHCPVENRTMRGIKVDWVTDALDRRDGDAA